MNDLAASSKVELRGIVFPGLFFSLLIGVFLLTARTARAHMNVTQVVAAVFFLIVIVRAIGASSASIASAPNHPVQGPRSIWGLSLAWMIGIVVWAPALSVYFVSDDFGFVAAAPRTALANLWQFVTGPTWGVFFRPIGFATIYFDSRLWHYSALGYHATNLFIHLFTIAGIFLLCKKLCWGAEFATFASLIYAVLPSRVEAVVWIGARFDLLSSCFVVWALVYYVKFRTTGRRSAYLIALALFLFAALSKENAYVLPLLIVALEFLVLPMRKLKPVLGFFVLAAFLFLGRWLFLGGIGGYGDAQGRPATFQFGFQSLEGLLLRGPAQLLLGYNWLQPPTSFLSIVVALTGAIFLVVALRARLGSADPKPLLFSFVWIVLAIAPAHPLLLIGAGLTNSRELELASVALALLTARLLVNCSSVFRVRCATAAALIVLLSMGTLHNIAAWNWTSQLSREFLAELKQFEPAPRAQTEFVVNDMPEITRGVFFLRLGLTDAVRMAYGRDDITAARVETPQSAPAPGALAHAVIHFQWTGEKLPLLRRIGN